MNFSAAGDACFVFIDITGLFAICSAPLLWTGMRTVEPCFSFRTGFMLCLDSVYVSALKFFDDMDMEPRKRLKLGEGISATVYLVMI